MKLLIILAILSIITVNCEHFFVGNTANGVVLANQTKIEYAAIPFIKRVKYYFYSQPDNRMIQGIQALDNMHSKSSINITAGGVGYSYVNLRMKSERGRGLSYDIGIYTLPWQYYDT